MPRATHLAGMAEDSRSVVGTMSEFAFLAEAYRDDMEATDLLMLSVRGGHPLQCLQARLPHAAPAGNRRRIDTLELLAQWERTARVHHDN